MKIKVLNTNIKFTCSHVEDVSTDVCVSVEKNLQCGNLSKGPPRLRIVLTNSSFQSVNLCQ